MNIEQLIKDQKSTVLDVRTREEFQGGHVSGSVNIPLQEIVDRLEEVKNLKAPLILCCASGNRSGMAARFLTEKGIECVNAGSWLDVNYHQANAIHS